MAAFVVTASGAHTGESTEAIFGWIDSNGSGVSLSLGTTVSVKISVVKAAASSANAFVGISLSGGIVLLGLSAYRLARRKLFAGNVRF